MINELAKEIHLNAKSKGFFDEPKNIGEMAMEGFKFSTTDNGSAASSMFQFSVNDPSILAIIQNNPSKRFKLTYVEYLHVKYSDGATSYFITSAEVLK